MESIEWREFAKVELRAGTIVKVEAFPEARKPAFKIWADFGELRIKKSSAQVTELYQRDGLLGCQIIGVLNFPSKQIGTFMSEFLVTGFVLEQGEVVLAQRERRVPNGCKLV
ncbi:MAG: tRNA-binding protein [Desulfobacterales bacterium]|nr:MAG: tRNA-binding protein [Desulfobacterales bacterium]